MLRLYNFKVGEVLVSVLANTSTKVLVLVSKLKMWYHPAL